MDNECSDETLSSLELLNKFMYMSNEQLQPMVIRRWEIHKAARNEIEKNTNRHVLHVTDVVGYAKGYLPGFPSVYGPVNEFPLTTKRKGGQYTSLYRCQLHFACLHWTWSAMALGIVGTSHHKCWVQAGQELLYEIFPCLSCKHLHFYARGDFSVCLECSSHVVASQSGPVLHESLNLPLCHFTHLAHPLG